MEGLTTNAIGGNVFDLYDTGSSIFPTSGEMSSCSGYCYDDDVSYPADLAAAFQLSPVPNSSALLDPAGNDQFDLVTASGGAAGIPLPTFPGVINVGSCYSSSYSGVFDESVTPNSCNSFLDQHSVIGGGFGAAMGGLAGGICGESPAMFAGGLLPESGLNLPDMDYQGESSGFYGPDSVYSSADLHVINETQQLMKGGCGSPLGSDMSTLEESTFKVGRLSAEERKEKIHRYMKKRNERNFTKKIKYACRKTLADSRPRVRGRFAKNEEFGEAARPNFYQHDDEEEEEEVGAKEEEMLEYDISTHITGVNSFKCNYPIQSWM